MTPSNDATNITCVDHIYLIIVLLLQEPRPVIGLVRVPSNKIRPFKDVIIREPIVVHHSVGQPVNEPSVPLEATRPSVSVNQPPVVVDVPKLPTPNKQMILNLPDRNRQQQPMVVNLPTEDRKNKPVIVNYSRDNPPFVMNAPVGENGARQTSVLLPKPASGPTAGQAGQRRADLSRNIVQGQMRQGDKPEKSVELTNNVIMVPKASIIDQTSLVKTSGAAPTQNQPTSPKQTTSVQSTQNQTKLTVQAMLAGKDQPVVAVKDSDSKTRQPTLAKLTTTKPKKPSDKPAPKKSNQTKSKPASSVDPMIIIGN